MQITLEFSESGQHLHNNYDEYPENTNGYKTLIRSDETVTDEISRRIMNEVRKGFVYFETAKRIATNA